MQPTITAIVLSDSNGTYYVEFYYIDANADNRRRLPEFPFTSIPCKSYDHARSVCAAFNQGA